ncbi:MAG TPA: protein kinase [Bryobacteraceae bacterium]
MALTAGTRLGIYEVSGPLGVGGMGEVYRARDTRLNREVAIKVLPDALSSDPARMQRFEREAQMLAALNHPNIAAIYGVEQGAIIMELVEGEDLRGPLPVATALDYARQIAAALEAAHEKGIIHRDLKPANIKVTAEGVVKLLDFGLAKAASEPVESAAGPTMSPTLSLAMTQAGMILGTAAYMSPEQARGKPADRRADIWAFGVVLYEVLTGRLLYGGGETVADSLAAVITKEPDWSLLPKDTPSHIRRLLERCLRKDVRSRLQAIGEARILIDEPAEMPVPSMAPAAARRSWLPWAVCSGVLAVALAGVGTVAWNATRPLSKPLVRLSLDIGPDAVLERTANGGMFALSPDGTRLALTLRGADGKIRLYTRLLRQSQLNMLAATENPYSPFFSPDGQWIGFFDKDKLKKISVEGGPAVTLCDATLVGRGGSWGEDGNIIASLGVAEPLSRVSSNGGKPTPVTRLQEHERTHRFPQVLPGGQAALFSASEATADFDAADIVAVSLKTGERKTLIHGGTSAHYLPSGHLVYIHQNSLFAAPFDLSRLALTGSPVPVLEDASSGSGAGADLAFSQTGLFIYLTGTHSQSGWPIIWIDSNGKREPLQAANGLYYLPRLSPDGKRLAYALGGGVTDDIWVRDLDRDTPARLTSLPGQNDYPVWTPDGRNIVFRNVNSPAPGLYRIRSDGSGQAQRLTDGKLADIPYSISPDGKHLAVFRNGAGADLDIFTLPFEGDAAHPALGQPTLFVGTKAVETTPAFSPDGRWLAYVSDETRTTEVYVRPFPGPGAVVKISNGGGIWPHWTRNGKELIFLTAPDHYVMAVSYSDKGDTFAAAQPRRWMETSLPFTTPDSYDVAPDGKRLVAYVPANSPGQKPVTQLTFLVNFFDELRRRTSEGGK